MFLQISIKDGKIASGKESLKETINKCPDGIYTIRMNYTSRPKTIRECRNQYFFMCDLISNEGATGYTSKEIHQLFKDKVLEKIPNLTSHIVDPMKHISFLADGTMKILYSTKMLNLEGWYAFIEGVKHYSKENLDFLL